MVSIGMMQYGKYMVTYGMHRYGLYIMYKIVCIWLVNI